jgi:cytochrome c oxidase cbb3-type subunit 2
MNYGPLIFLGVFGSFVLSWVAMILAPQLQLGNEQPALLPPASILYPTAPPGLAQQGREVYRANGCQYCHTQVVRHEGYTPANMRSQQYGADFARHWGTRNSVARDYLYDQPVMLGTVRVGPDLKNIGQRRTNEVWHYLHLYNPQLTSKGSIMPPYPYLFQKRKLGPGQTSSPNAIAFPGESGPEAGYEIVPKHEAVALVHYLMTLQSDLSVPGEAPVPPPAGQGTNAAPGTAGATNAPASDPSSAQPGGPKP